MEEGGDVAGGEGVVMALVGGDCGEGGDVVGIERARDDGHDGDGGFEMEEEGRGGYVRGDLWNGLVFDRARFEKWRPADGADCC